MFVEIDEDNFNEYLNRGEGYLVNKTRSTEAKAHDLTHLCAGCRNTLKYDPADTYAKLWADTLQNAQQAALQEWRVTCSACERCV